MSNWLWWRRKMIKIQIVVAPNSIDIESDTATIAEVTPIINQWFDAIKGTNNAEKGKIEFKIQAENQ